MSPVFLVPKKGPKKKDLGNRFKVVKLYSSRENMQQRFRHSATIYDTTEVPYEFKLLLRGSRDGYKSEVFHRLCDNISGNVVAIKINSTNEILGDYNLLIWKVSNNNGEYSTTADSFIFSLKTMEI
ncbi:3985_t:CDS:2 [Gigaspora rosea]|nr:3985_t:CDS:2 [Gigaspora rosea]